MALLTLAGALLRLPFNTQFPPGLQGDEAWLGLEAQRILREGWTGIWTPTGWGQPAGIFYWTALLFRFFPDTTAVLRASVGILGVATIPVFYLFARRLYGPRAAIIGTALLTFSYWDIHYSRTAFTLVAAPLVECAVFLCLGKGVKERRAWPFLVAGTLTGAGIYTYRGYALFVLLIAAFWGALLLYRPYRLRRLALHALFFALPALLLAVPMLKFVVEQYDEYIGYGRIVSVFQSEGYRQAEEPWERAGFLAYKLGRAMAVYYVGRGADPTDGLGTWGLLDPLTGLSFSIGLVIAVRRRGQWQYLLIPVAVAAGIAAVASTVEWGENRRGIVALPFVFAAAGVGGDALLTWARRLLWRLRAQGRAVPRPWLGRACLAAAFLTMAGWNAGIYLGSVVPGGMTRLSYAAELGRATAFLASMEQDEPYVYFYSYRWSWDYEARRFQAPGLEGEDRSEEFGEFTLEWRAEDREVVYLLMPPYDRYAEELRERYPGGEYGEVVEAGRRVFAAYYLDRDADTALVGGQERGSEPSVTRDSATGPAAGG